MNVIGCRPDGWWKDRAGAVVRLVERVEAWAGQAGDAVTVVVDGRPVPGVASTEGVEVVFAPGGRDAADDEIVRIVEASADPATLVVVTSDRGLAGRVQALGASVEGARGFRDLVDP